MLDINNRKVVHQIVVIFLCCGGSFRRLSVQLCLLLLRKNVIMPILFSYPLCSLLLNFWGGLSHNPLRITFMVFAMIGANIFPAVATIREESKRIIRRYSKCGGSCCCLRNYSVNNSNSIDCSITCEGIPFQSFNHTSPCKRINSNPGSYLFPIWWDECVCGWSITTSCSRTEKWQVQLNKIKYNTL